MRHLDTQPPLGIVADARFDVVVAFAYHEGPDDLRLGSGGRHVRQVFIHREVAGLAAFGRDAERDADGVAGPRYWLSGTSMTYPVCRRRLKLRVGCTGRTVQRRARRAGCRTRVASTSNWAEAVAATSATKIIGRPMHNGIVSHSAAERKG